jgi:hypothetical protein
MFDTIHSDGGLEESERLTSNNQANHLIMQSDCSPVWASNTNLKRVAPYRLVMHDDSNLVIYDAHNKPTWATNTNR